MAKEYGKRVRENSKSLAETIDERGLKIRFPPEYTESHQILVEKDALIRDFGITFSGMCRKLEENGIIVDCVGRIGTAELTWRGYGKGDMKEIGSLIVRALRGEKVRKEVKKIVEKWDGKTMGERARE